MRLVTVQDKAAYDDLCATGVLRCNPKLAEWLCEDDFLRSYDWLIEQMKHRVGDPPDGVTYPIWAWHTLYGKPAKADLRRTELNNYHGENYILTVQIPDGQVLLSDEENWHCVLNNGYFGEDHSEAEYEKTELWFDSLSPSEQLKVKRKSWERVFDVTPFENEWHRRGCFVQATFWELRKGQVLSARRFIGRQK